MGGGVFLAAVVEGMRARHQEACPHGSRARLRAAADRACSLLDERRGNLGVEALRGARGWSRRAASYTSSGTSKPVAPRGLDDLHADFHAITEATTQASAEKAYARFVARWRQRCPGVARSLEAAGKNP